MEILRTCRICGVEGTAENVDELFVKCKRSTHGYKLLCKKCGTVIRTENAKKKGGFKDQAKTHQWVAEHNGPLFCYFCENEITKLKGRDSESLCLHSLDENHENWNHENKVPTHYGCHSHHHSFKGDEVTPHAKYMREWYAEKRGFAYPKEAPA